MIPLLALGLLCLAQPSEAASQSRTAVKLKGLLGHKETTTNPQPPQDPAQAKPPLIKPDWVDATPDLPGRMYAVGVADLGTSEAQSLARAGDRAKVEVVARLRATVKGQTVMSTKSVVTQSTGQKASASSEKTFRDDVAVTAQAEDLPGLTVEKTFLDAPGRTAYALAYLDTAQAQQSLGARLRTLKEVRVKAERETTRKARWRLRKAMTDLDQLDGQAAMLAPIGLPEAIRDAIQTEKDATERRLSKLESLELPPLDMSKMSAAVRTNIDLPPALADWLDVQIKQAGLKRRDAGADFILELTFQGGSKGHEFIFSEPQFIGGILYRLEAKATLKDTQGVILGRVAPISLTQDDTAKGMMEEFQRIFLRRWRMLAEQLRAELE